MPGDVVDKMLHAVKIGIETGGEAMTGGPGGPGPMHGPRFTEDGEKLYDRMFPHPEDMKHDGMRADPKKMRKVVYEDVEIIFDVEKIND